MIKIEDFGEVEESKAINCVVYGLQIKVISKKSTATPSVFALCEHDFNHLERIPIEKSKKKAVTRIELNEISSVSNVKIDPVKNKNSKFDSELILKILHGKNKQLLLLFDDKETKGLFWGGLLHFMERSNQEEEKMYIYLLIKHVSNLSIERIQEHYLQEIFSEDMIRMAITF